MQPGSSPVLLLSVELSAGVGLEVGAMLVESSGDEELSLSSVTGASVVDPEGACRESVKVRQNAEALGGIVPFFELCTFSRSKVWMI